MLKKGAFIIARGNIQPVSVVKLLYAIYVYTSMTSSNSHLFHVVFNFSYIEYSK